MKTLKHHVILYDSECPMCKAYTHAFISTGMLDSHGRAPYQQMPPFACPLVDRQRAVNEIALVDKTTGEVTYGIDSLFKVIAHSFPLFRPLFTCRLFAWLMRKTYAFISYNRKIIIPAPRSSAPTLQPAFNIRYRLAYLLFTTILTGCILTSYSHLLTGILARTNAFSMYLICIGQLVFQFLIISLCAPKQRWDYLGNMMTISLAGALLLLPVMLVAAFTHISPYFATGYLFPVVILMLIEYIRRVRLLFRDHPPI